MLTESYGIIESLQLPHGLYRAAMSTHYNRVWIRDSVYCAMVYADKTCGTYERVYCRLLDLFGEYEWKLDIHGEVKPVETWEYFHSRFTADTVREITEESWGHNQLDAIGAFLFGIAGGLARGKRMLRGEDDARIIRKIIAYLQCVEYWRCPDNGIWEENTELHASSVGACLAALIALRPFIDIPPHLIVCGSAALDELGDRESDGKDVDMAQLSLIYPYRIVSQDVAERIISKVEARLLRGRGVIRYENDRYFSNGREAEWTMGLPWLALCHQVLGNGEKADEYIGYTEWIALDGGVLPELYYGGTPEAGPNSPLGWASSLYILAKERSLK